MNTKDNQDSLNTALSLFKEGYESPTKALIWAKAVKEWAGIVVGGFFVGFILLFLLLILIVAIREQNEITPATQSTPHTIVHSAEPGSVDQQAIAEQKIEPHIKVLLTFMAVTVKSLTKRQEIFESLLSATSHVYGDDQKALEQKLTSLATLARRCTAERGKFVSHIAKNSNPFEADIFHMMQKLLHNTQDSFWENSRTGVPLDPSVEVSHWNRLCSLCNQEVEKANIALLQNFEQ